MKILGIDPGTEKSGLVLLDGKDIIFTGVQRNDVVLAGIKAFEYDLLAIEMIHSQGMKVGKSVFETLAWIGVFAANSTQDFQLVHRPCLKMHLLGTARGSDANIRAALIKRLGAPGTKATPGATYGVASHAWQALAVAYCVQEGAKLYCGRNQLNTNSKLTLTT